MNAHLLRLNIPGKGSDRLKYERLKSYLVQEMAAGRLKAGESLPSENRFAEMLGITRKTIRRAMASLESDGLIRRVQGKGNFVEEGARQKLKRGLDIFALVVPETREGFYPSLLHGFEAAAGEVHHQTLICNTDDDVERQAAIVLQLIDKKVGGVVLNPTTPQPTPAYQVRQLQERGIPVVFCHRRVSGITAPVLALPFHGIGRMAGEVLVKQGHRRVALFTESPLASGGEVVENGLREALHAFAGDLSIQYVKDRPITLREETCWAALQQTFAKPDPPTAIFASFDPLAEMIYLMLLRLGIRVPEDVSLLGFGGAWREAALTRQLTSVVVDEINTGRQAVSLLHEMRSGERPIDDNTEIVMKLELSEGKTLGAAVSSNSK